MFLYLALLSFVWSMKKILVILLLMVYGLSSSGMTLHFHYCCGQLENIDLDPVEASDCGKDHKSLHGKPCCEVKSVELKVSSDQKISSISLNNPECPSIPFREIPFGPAVNFSEPEFCLASGPPLIYEPSLIILNCVYRI